MKILLLGEFSALHKNLKEGLQELGHEVVIASSGDGWKDIERDIDLSYDNGLMPSKLTKRIYPFFDFKNLSGFDIVQIINPFILYKSFFPNKFFMNRIIGSNKKVFVLAAGDDSYFWKFGRQRLAYGPFDDSLKYDYKKENHPYESDKMFKFNEWITHASSGVIPIMYEYQISYEGHSNLMTTIPIPMNIEKIQYIENKVNEKLIVFHGLNRYGFKGTRHVEKAFAILKERYPDKLELIIDGNMPLNKYLEVMKKTNVVIDQTNSYSLGVNGIYAMAMGKVVLGGAEPESLKSIGVKNSPAINIKPNAQSIVEEIEKLLEKKDQIKEIGMKSRKFVEEVHGHINIARKYLKTWGIK